MTFKLIFLLFLQIRQIQRGSVCIGQLFCGDCIYSVNGIAFKNINHAQALQILKQCRTQAKFVLLRSKSWQMEDEEELAPTQQRRKSNKFDSKAKMSTKSHNETLPGTIANDDKSHLIRPTMHRRTTESSSMVSIPRIADGLSSSSPLATTMSLAVPIQNDGDGESSDNSSNPNTPSILPKCHAVNRRSNVGAFMLRKEKTFKTLGIDVMIDEFGLCHVTDILPHGMFAGDDRIRYQKHVHFFSHI